VRLTIKIKVQKNQEKAKYFTALVISGM
jgi:hypothetical protein